MGVPASLKLLPRFTLVDLLLQQALAGATVLWTEIAQGGSAICESEAEELVDIIVAALAQLDQVQKTARGIRA